MKNAWWIVAGVALGGLVSLAMGTRRKTAPITLVQGEQRRRGCDAGGCGHFGASRGARLHKGYDVLSIPGAQVRSPVKGKITRFVDPYGDGRYNGIQIDTEKEVWKIMYMQPIQQLINRDVKPGDILGYAQNIALKYPSVQPHLHVEIWKNGVAIDPEPYIF